MIVITGGRGSRSSSASSYVGSAFASSAAVTISIFFLGHLTPILVAASRQSANANEFVQFMARLFRFALPDLELLNTGPAIATGAIIPWVSYVLPALGYCVLYSGAALFLAFLLFENRDVA